MRNQAVHTNKSYIRVVVIWFIQIALTSAACSTGTGNCAACANVNDCQTCFSGYGLELVGGFTVCSTCTAAACITCPTHPNNCASCGPWYRLNGNNCQSCTSGVCQRCPAHPDTCTVCNYNYRVTATNSCQRCTQLTCRSCNSGPDICTDCYIGYGVATTNDTCVPCADPNCISCSLDYNDCDECDSNFGVHLGQCANCTDAHCISCTWDYTICLECEVGYGRYNGDCRTCVFGNCLQCEQDDATFCTRCVDGYRATSSGNCQACTVSRCAQCPVSMSACINCTSGYGLNGAICSLCASPCVLCDGTDYTMCTSCINRYYLDGSTCTVCMDQCLQCNDGATCNICNTTYYLDGASVCVLCPQYCTSCEYYPSTDSPSCTACQQNYGLSQFEPYSCPQICGDLKAYSTPCDYARGNQYDGCDDFCNVQDGFICSKNGTTAVCSYENQTLMEIKSLIRDPFSNSFTLKVSFWPPLYVFKNSDLKSVFRLNSPIFTIRSVTFEYQTSQFTIIVDFSGSYFDQEIVLEFIPSIQVDERYFATLNNTASIMTKLFLYSDMTLKTSLITPYLCYIILILGLLAAVLGLPFKRLAGLEAIVVCQMGMLSRILINSYFLSPFSVATLLQYSTGIRLHLFDNSNKIGRLLLYQQIPAQFKNPPQYKGFNYDEFMLSNNYNVVLCLQGLPFVIFVFTFLIMKCMQFRLATYAKQKNQENISILKQRISSVNRVRQLSMQLLMYFGIFNLANFFFCVCIFFKNNSKYTEFTSLVVLAIGGIIYLVTYIAFWFDPDPFDYFRYSFRKQPFDMLFYFFYSFAIVSSTILLALLSPAWPPLIPMGILFFFILIYRPYREFRENIRSAFNILVILCGLSLRFYVNNAYSGLIKVNDSAFAFSFINIILLIIVTIIAATLVIYHIVYICCIKPKEELNEKQKVMFELQQLDVRQKMKTFEQKDTVFKKLLGYKVNVLDFSNILINSDKTTHGLKSDRRQREEDQDEGAAVSKQVRKEIEKERIFGQYDSTKSSIEKKIEYINDLKYQMETEQIELTKEEREDNKKMIYAMEVLAEENTWVRLKNAKDYTEEKMKEQTSNQQVFLSEYDNIEIKL